MKKGFRHIVSLTLLVLIVAYSLPFLALHHCDRFKVHSSTTVIEEGHPDCYLCDLQLNTFIPTLPFSDQVIFFLIGAIAGLSILSFPHQFIRRFNNKGPPVPVFI